VSERRSGSVALVHIFEPSEALGGQPRGQVREYVSVLHAALVTGHDAVGPRLAVDLSGSNRRLERGAPSPQIAHDVVAHGPRSLRGNEGCRVGTVARVPCAMLEHEHIRAQSVDARHYRVDDYIERIWIDAEGLGLEHVSIVHDGEPEPRRTRVDADDHRAPRAARSAPLVTASPA
jgi:hypothetical protein